MNTAAERSRQNINSVEKWASIAAGAGLAAYGLSRLRKDGWVWTGVGGLLLRRGITAHCDIYQALGVDTSRAASDTRTALRGSRGINVLESVTINRPISELYRFWRNLENLPQFMRHLVAVDKVTDTISRWRAHGPAGTTVEWEAEVYNEVPDKLIAWRSLDGSSVVSAGSVNFDEAGPGRGTRVTVRLRYSPPGGRLGATLAKLFGADPETEIRADLRRFKQVVEAGEAPARASQTHG